MLIYETQDKNKIQHDSMKKDFSVRFISLRDYIITLKYMHNILDLNNINCGSE